MGDENPDWLPAGWMVTVKIRNYGRKDKYYINPSNGLKLNSKAEVLRYLESCSGEVQKAKDLNKVDIETSAVEKLPPGWIKEIRTVKKRGRTRKEPYYTDPVSGREFRSLQEVFQYLEIEDLGQTKHKPDEKDQITAKLEDHSQSSSAEVIDKEADMTISRCKRVKSEVEVGGSSVGSTMKTVNVAEKNNQEEDDSLAMEVSDKLQPVSRAERYAYRIRKRESDGGDHISKSGSKAVSPKKVEMQKETYVEQKVREDDPLAVDLPNKLQNGEEHHEAEITQNKLAANSNLENNATGDQSLQSGSKDDAVKETETDVPETNSSEQTREHNSVGDQQQENVANPPNKTKKPNRISATELPRRTSKRIAHVEVNPSLEIKPTKKPKATPTLSGTVQQVNNTKNNGHVRFGFSEEPEIDITGENGQLDEPNEHFTECKTENLISDKQKELVRSLFEDPCCTEDLNGVCVEIKEDEKQVEPALENLLMDPCYGFAIKTLKGDIPIEEAKKVDNIINNTVAPPNEAQASSSSMVLAAGNIWDDPSFEFAVKMLTSDSPTKDGSHFSISFEQSLCSSGASRCNGLALPKPTLGDSNYLFSGFDSEKKPLPLPNNIVNGSSSSSSEQFQPFATGLKDQGRKFGEL